MLMKQGALGKFNKTNYIHFSETDTQQRTDEEKKIPNRKFAYKTKFVAHFPSPVSFFLSLSSSLSLSLVRYFFN